MSTGIYGLGTKGRARVHLKRKLKYHSANLILSSYLVIQSGFWLKEEFCALAQWTSIRFSVDSCWSVLQIIFNEWLYSFRYSIRINDVIYVYFDSTRVKCVQSIRLSDKYLKFVEVRNLFREVSCPRSHRNILIRSPGEIIAHHILRTRSACRKVRQLLYRNVISLEGNSFLNHSTAMPYFQIWNTPRMPLKYNNVFIVM